MHRADVRSLGMLLALTLGCGAVAANEEGGGGWRDWHADNDINSTASLQRGARNFVNYCMGCHSLQYVRYNRMANDLQISEEQLQANLMFTGQRVHDVMLSAMSPKDAEEWFGRAPDRKSVV